MSKLGCRARFAATVAAVVTLGIVAGPAGSSTQTVPTASAPEPRALEHARVIRAEINAAYRRVSGRKLVVTEATSTDVGP